MKEVDLLVKNSDGVVKQQLKAAVRKVEEGNLFPLTIEEALEVVTSNQLPIKLNPTAKGIEAIDNNTQTTTLFDNTTAPVSFNSDAIPVVNLQFLYLLALHLVSTQSAAIVKSRMKLILDLIPDRFLSF